MKRRRRDMHPMDRLAQALNVAALNIETPIFRKIAAREAATIPKCRAEIGGGRRGEMARAGRALLARLATLPQEEWAETVQLLRGYADAIASDFRVTSEVSLGDRKRRAS